MFMIIKIGKKNGHSSSFRSKPLFFRFLPLSPTPPIKYFLPSFYIVRYQFVRFGAWNIIVFQILYLIKSIKKRILVVYDTAGNGGPLMSNPHSHDQVELLVPSSLEAYSQAEKRLKGAELLQSHHGNLALGLLPWLCWSEHSLISSPSQSNFQSNVCSKKLFILQKLESVRQQKLLTQFIGWIFFRISILMDYSCIFSFFAFISCSPFLLPPTTLSRPSTKYPRKYPLWL